MYRKKYWSEYHKRFIPRSQFLHFAKLGRAVGLSFDFYKLALKLFVQDVFKNHGFYCGVCKSKTGLTIHHVFFKGIYPKMSLIRNNGIPLCFKCHCEVHGRIVKNFV